MIRLLYVLSQSRGNTGGVHPMGAFAAPLPGRAASPACERRSRLGYPTAAGRGALRFRMGKGEFIQAVMRSCMTALAGIGLHERESGIAMTEASADGIAGWIGLGTATPYSSSELVVFPNVGVRWDALNRLEDEVRGQKTRARLLRNAATIATPLYTLMPPRARKEFSFRVEEPPERAARRLARAVKTYGLPYMQKHSRIKSVIAGIRKDSSWEEVADSLLCAEYLTDPNCDLKERIRSQLATARSEGLDVADFRAFSRRLLALSAAKRALARSPRCDVRDRRAKK